MKRMPLLMTLLALIALSASSAYWVMQLYKPAQRPLATAPVASLADPAIDAAASLFGGQPAASASNYQLLGVVAAGRDSAAIIVVDNGTPLTLKVGRELASGLRVQQVYPRYVLLSDGRRIEIAQDNRPAGGAGAAAAGQPGQALPVMPQPQPVQQPQAAPIQMPQPSMTGAPMPATPPPPNVMPLAPPLRNTPGMTGQPVLQ
ncbi:type II secretion system protein N [Massilia sp. PWRC2]|uniref:type II secretion system protein N n=1 Tax=Massilia sp. PWRC2 TaxID=2804626 RepID=UPI003CE70478